MDHFLRSRHSLSIMTYFEPSSFVKILAEHPEMHLPISFSPIFSIASTLTHFASRLASHSLVPLLLFDIADIHPHSIFILLRHFLYQRAFDNFPPSRLTFPFLSDDPSLVEQVGWHCVWP